MGRSLRTEDGFLQPQHHFALLVVTRALYGAFRDLWRSVAASFILPAHDQSWGRLFYECRSAERPESPLSPGT